MLNFLVVDDDSLIRQGICSLIQKYCMEKYFIHEAENGWKGIEKTCANAIDIIFADVKMPLCDGLEMLQKLRKMQYCGQIVIISGFDDFSFVRTAMKLGAADYLLKPILSKEFKAVLSKCIAAIHSQKGFQYFSGDNTVQNEWRIYLTQQSKVEALLSADPAGALSLLEKYQIRPQKQTCLFLVDTGESSDMDDTGKMNTFLNISNAAGALCKDGEVVLLQGEYKNLWAVIVIGYGQAVINALKEYLRKNNCRFAFTEKGSAEYIFGMYQECIESMNQFFYDLGNTEQCGSPVRTENNLGVDIVDDICDCNAIQFTKDISEMFQIENQKQPPLENFKKLLCGLVYSVMSKNDRFISVVSKYKFTDQDIINVITDSASAFILLRQIIDIISLYISEAAENVANQEDFTIARAKDYISRNYMNDLSLTQVADYLSLNPVYFSSYFKNKTGKTYCQFLRHIRIESAKELIRSTNQKFYQIAESIGYHDNSQFYRAFKDETGCSPEEFKKSQSLQFNCL